MSRLFIITPALIFINTFILVFVTYNISSTQGQILILPGPEIKDPFKDNGPWLEFLENQEETADTLKTLVDNVWRLIDSIQIPNPKVNLKDTFVQYHVRAFSNFFNRVHQQQQLRNGNAFPSISTAIGAHNVSSLLMLSKSSNDTLDQLRLKWLAIDEMALVIHNVFSKVTEAILMYDEEFEETLVAFVERETFSIWNPAIIDKPGNDNIPDPGAKTIKQLAELLDTQFGVTNGMHSLRELLKLLEGMKQSNVNMHQYFNYYCFGNNEFGVIPWIINVVQEAGLYLVMADMKKLVLDVYLNTFNTFFNRKSGAKPNQSLEYRKIIWAEMAYRINRKTDFPDLEGLGWNHPAGPIIFKCDKPPKDLLGNTGQWGRSITTGITPNASQTFLYDLPAGPLKSNATFGYLDDRTPQFHAVWFEGAFQGYIESELVLNPTSSCRDTCPVFRSMTKVCDRAPQHCALFRGSHCDPIQGNCMDRSGCPSYAMNCRRTSKEVKICPSSEPHKRYDWISLNGQILKRSNIREDSFPEGFDIDSNTPACPGGNVTTAFERFSMENGIILNAPAYCELCLCTCMTPLNPEDQQYFDIRPVLTNVQEGMIVSAVRFTKENNVVRLAVEEGKPAPRGQLEVGTQRWIETGPADKREDVQAVPLGVSGFMRFNFDLLIGDWGTVVTGIRFKFDKVTRSIGLEVQVTPIAWPTEDPSKISLKPGEALWLNETTKASGPREPMTFAEPGDPLSQKGPSMPDSVLNSYVEFTTTDYEVDLGQTVIPMFDAQAVSYHERRSWLRGVGVIHKGKPGSGGFIAPIVVPANPFRANRYFPTPQE